MQITRNASRASTTGPAEWFSGRVRMEPVVTAPDPARVAAVLVTFEPGARTAWHTHPLGQTLLVVSGLGRAQREGGRIEELHPGDVVWFEPGERHWHGASPDRAMCHLAIQERQDGRAVDWQDHVTDADYTG
ncbi:(R)-mandelonitrile lyase [Paracoccus salsus]|uniref:(R)-mandelonitrile lyase n=1 Tax=Paracoccus salsus TaxID=2911061 RepID=UPI001F3F0264|nr:cupin domain-containing protein [Paracoccus salsus]MCF3973618.1 cupin domain-containing protein [Paracoccus salsus]